MSKTSDKGLAARRKSYDLLLQKVEGGQSLTPTEITAMTRFEEEIGRAGLDLPDNFKRVDQVEQYTGYKSRTIYNAITAGELFRKSDNSFDRDEVDAWLRLKGREPNLQPSGPPPVDDDDDEIEAGKRFSSKDEEAKFRHFRAKREEIMVLRLQGELIPRAAMLEAQVARAHEYKTSILLLSRRVSHRIAAVAGIESRVVSDILDEEAKMMLASLCRKVDLHVD